MRRAQLLLVLILVLGIGAQLAVAPDEADTRSGVVAKPSTFYTDEYGAQVAFRLLERLEYRTKRWRQPFSALAGEEGAGQLMIILGPDVPADPTGLEELAGWVHRGGHILLATTVEWPARGLEVGPDPELGPFPLVETATETFDLLPSLGFSYDYEEVTLSVEEDFPDLNLQRPGTFDQALGFDGAPPYLEGVSTTLWVGDGSVTVVGDEAVFSNLRLSETGNELLLLDLIEQTDADEIFFDEYHLGFEEQRELMTLIGLFLFKTPWGWFTLHLAAVGLLALYHQRRRLGPPRPDPTPLAPDATDATAALLEWIDQPTLMEDLVERWRTLRGQRKQS